jgi:D-alanyl-D-alanine carboxypeptidase
MKKGLNQITLDQIVQRISRRKTLGGAVFYVSTDNNGVDAISAAGEFNVDSTYYIASINKLFVSSIILKLFHNGKLDLHDKISRYLPSHVMKGLHVYKGQDFSDEITIAHLLAQTSGLPCYLTDKQTNGKKVMSELEAGKDQAWPIEKAMEAIKTMSPHFPPGSPRKAIYGDTNHQILSKIIEHIQGDTISNILTNLFEELNMTNTYVCSHSNTATFIPIRCGSETTKIPNFITSTQNDIISTAKDQMIFLKAFVNGHFFPKEKLNTLKIWNNIFFPFKYGIGIQKFHLPWIFHPFHSLPEIIGHCGSTGTIAFYVPDMNLYITGTVNQQKSPHVAFQALLKIILKMKQS